MLVKIVIKKIEDKDNNTVYITKKQMTMKEARKQANEYNKEGILWLKAKWFGTWHNNYRTLWKKEE